VCVGKDVSVAVEGGADVGVMLGVGVGVLLGVSVRILLGVGVGVLLGVGVVVFVGVGVGVLPDTAVLLDMGALLGVGASVLPGVGASLLEGVCVSTWVTLGGGVVEGTSDSTAVDVGVQVDVVAGITGGVAVIRSATRSNAVSATDLQPAGNSTRKLFSPRLFPLISQRDGKRARALIPLIGQCLVLCFILVTALKQQFSRASCCLFDVCTV
jgi:hypothetical protein